MEVVTLEKELNSLAYHGRGIVIGKSADGTKAVIAYFIMGRSENSRNRSICRRTATAFSTQAFRPIQDGRPTASSSMHPFECSATRPLSQTATRPTRFMSIWTSWIDI